MADEKFVPIPGGIRLTTKTTATHVEFYFAEVDGSRPIKVAEVEKGVLQLDPPFWADLVAAFTACQRRLTEKRTGVAPVRMVQQRRPGKGG